MEDNTWIDDTWIDDTWIMACDVPLFPPDSPSMTTRGRNNIKKRRRTYGGASFHGDQGNSVGPTTGVTSGDSASVTSGDSTSVTSGDSASVTSGDSTGGDQSAAMTIQEFKRQARNRREQQRSVLISKRMMELGEVIRKANVVPLPSTPLKKIQIVTLAIDTIRALQAKIQTHTQEGEMPAVVCG